MGGPSPKASLHKLLTNVAYAGQVRHRSELYNGEQLAVVDPETWRKVQSLLARNGRTGGAPVRNKIGALLKGLLHCVPCRSAMTPTHTSRNGSKRYRYYVCSSAQQRGWDTCPSKSIPAGEIERLVVERIRCVGRDPILLEQVLEQVRSQCRGGRAVLEAE